MEIKDFVRMLITAECAEQVHIMFVMVRIFMTLSGSLIIMKGTVTRAMLVSVKNAKGLLPSLTQYFSNLILM